MALDEVGVLSVGNVVEIAINMVNEVVSGAGYGEEMEEGETVPHR